MKDITTVQNAKAIAVKGIKRFFYRKISGGSFKNVRIPCHCAFYNDGGKFGIISGNKITWLNRGEMIFVSPDVQFRPVAEGMSVKLFFCSFY